MSLSYVRTTWEDNKTSLNAENLNNIESGIANLTNEVNRISDGLPETFAKVAVTGKYSDISGIPALKDVATSGDYNSLINKPVLHPIATTGNYNDLYNLPNIPNVSLSGQTGDYNDLKNKPTKLSEFENDEKFVKRYEIPDVTNIDAKTFDNHGPSYYLDYKNLTNKPKLSSLENDAGFITAQDLRTLSQVAYTGNYSDLSGTPKKLSDFINDVPFIKELDIDNILQKHTQFYLNYDNFFNKPTKLSDFSNDKQYLTRLDMPTLSIAELPKVFSNVAYSGDYTDLHNVPAIPNKMSQLQNDAGYLQIDDINRVTKGEYVFGYPSKLRTFILGYRPQYIRIFELLGQGTIINEYQLTEDQHIGNTELRFTDYGFTLKSDEGSLYNRFGYYYQWVAVRNVFTILPEVTSEDNGKILMVNDGGWSLGETTNRLPTIPDESKRYVLQAVNGIMSWIELPNAEDDSF